MKKQKALPAPIEKQKKRRGGKRFRKLKANFEVTELGKQANRMQFNVAQSEDVTTGAEFGMIGSSATGRVRTTVSKDTQKLGKSTRVVCVCVCVYVCVCVCVCVCCFDGHGCLDVCTEAFNAISSGN